MSLGFARLALSRTGWIACVLVLGVMLDASSASARRWPVNGEPCALTLMCGGETLLLSAVPKGRGYELFMLPPNSARHIQCWEFNGTPSEGYHVTACGVDSTFRLTVVETKSDEWSLRLEPQTGGDDDEEATRQKWLLKPEGRGADCIGLQSMHRGSGWRLGVEPDADGRCPVRMVEAGAEAGLPCWVIGQAP